MKRKLLCAIVLLFFTVSLSAQTSTKGKEFWFGFMENLTLSFNGPPKFYVVVSADVVTSGKISQPLTGIELDFVLSAGETKVIQLPDAIYYQSGSDVSSAFGFSLTTNDPISAKVIHDRQYFTEASILYPIEMLGSNYQVLTRMDAMSIHPSSFLIVALDDNTTIDITPSTTTSAVKPANRTYSIQLNKGNTYQVQANGNLSGSSIVARDNKKIAVFSGARQAYVHDMGCSSGASADNHLYEQSLPLQYAATDFLFSPLFARKGDPISVLFLESNTELKIDGVKLNRVFNKGTFDTTLLTSCLIQASRPVFVAQFSKSLNCGKTQESLTGDPSLFYIQPLQFKGYNECFNTHSSFPMSPITNHYLNVICDLKDTAKLKVDNVHPKAGFKVFPNNAKYAYSAIEVSAGKHCVNSDSGFQAYAYGFGNYNGYSFGLGFKTDVDDQNLNYQSFLFPNPVTTKLVVHYNIPKAGSLQIEYQLYDAISKELTSQAITLTKNNSELTIDMEPFAAAVYFLRIRVVGSKKYTVHKLIKL